MFHKTLLPLVAVTALWGQTAFRGKVASSGQPIPGASVTVTQAGKSYSIITGEDGRFQVDLLENSPISIKVEMFGFDPFQLELSADKVKGDLDLPISVAAYRPAREAARPVQSEASAEVSADIASPQIPTMPGMEPDSSESFLVQGSLSRGLSPPTPMGPEIGPAGFGPPGGMAGMGGPQVFPGAESAAPGGMDVLAARSAAAGPGGGMRGGGGPGGRMPGGGPGGGPGGMGPGGGPGMMGGPEAIRARIANMSPEQRQRMRAMIEDRMRQRGFAEGFGNRSRRVRDQIRFGVFFSARNSVFDATPFAVNGRAVEKPDYAQYRYGVNFGGPVKLGKLFSPENSFFFLNYTGVRGRNPYTGFAVMPDDAFRAGNFSGSEAVLYDPLAAAPFPNNVIPSSRISPVSQSLLPLIPQPNSAGVTQNYKLITSIPQNTSMLMLRLNRTLNARNRLAFSANLQSRSSERVQLYGYRDPNEGSGQNYDLSFTHNFSSRLITTNRFRYNRNRNQTLPFFAFGEDISAQAGIVGNSREPINYGPPNLDFTNFGSLNDGNHSLRVIHTWNFANSWTYIRGRHTISTGFEFTRVQQNSVLEQNARGTLFFGGLATSAPGIARSGLDFADFLLGYPQQSTIRYGGADTYMRQSQYGLFVQDDFRVNSGLTFSLGLRWDDWEPFTEKYGRLANLALAPGGTAAAVVTPGGTLPSGEAVAPGLIGADRNNFSPRIGFSWRPFKKNRAVLRGGYSLFYDSSVYGRVPSRLTAQPPFAVSGQLNSGIDGVLLIQAPFGVREDGLIRNSYSINPGYRVPYAQTWSFSIQQELKGNFVLETGYLGTKGTALVIQRAPNRAFLSSGGQVERPIANALSFTYDSPEGNSIFHALQVRLLRRMRRGVSWTAFYTYSKSIDNASAIGGAGNIVVQDDENLAAERGLSNFDKRHQFTFNAFYTSPFGPRGQFLRQPSLWAAVLRDWTLNGNLTANSGTPFTATVLGSGADSTGTGTTGSNRADATGVPVDSGSGYFNTAAFRVPPGGLLGNAARNTIPGPHFVVLNASIGRSFQITDNTRRAIEFRVSANNLLNQVNITGLGAVVNAANYGLATAAGDMRSFQWEARFRF